jgi:predicted dehydrogenase
MNKQSKIRIGIVGAGAIVKQRHLPGLQMIPGVEVVVVCNKRAESAEKVASAFGIPEIATCWKDLVERPDLDVIWIGTTPHLHASISSAALEAGKNVFCQARMAMNLAEARQMVMVAQKHPNQTTMLCPPPNGMKHGKYFTKLLQDGFIGQILHFHLNSLNASWADPSMPAHWRQRVELSGNNVLSIGIYAEVLDYFLGQPLSLCAQGQVCIPERQGYFVKIPDFVQVLGLWPQHIYGCLEWSGLAQFAPSDTLTIYGTEGTLVYDFASDNILAGHRGGINLESVPIPKEYVRSWTVEDDFIRSLRSGGQPEPSFATGLRYMQFIEAIQWSLKEQRWVELSSL